MDVTGSCREMPRKQLGLNVMRRLLIFVINNLLKSEKYKVSKTCIFPLQFCISKTVIAASAQVASAIFSVLSWKIRILFRLVNMAMAI